MANMSYCRFENTARDVRDCLAATDPYNSEYPISKGEAEIGVRMFKNIMDWAVENNIIQDYDEDAIQVVFDEHARIHPRESFDR